MRQLTVATVATVAQHDEGSDPTGTWRLLGGALPRVVPTNPPMPACVAKLSPAGEREFCASAASPAPRALSCCDVT